MLDAHLWEIKPSIRQRQIDLLLWSLLLVLVWALHAPVWIKGIVFVLPLLLFWQWIFEQKISHIGLYEAEFYLLSGAKKRFIVLKSGSSLSTHTVHLRWSLLPWQSLVLKQDCFHSAVEFQNFKRALYGLL